MNTNQTLPRPTQAGLHVSSLPASSLTRAAASERLPSRRSVLMASGIGVLALAFSGFVPSSAQAASASPDLYFIKTRNTGSGKVEVHTATAASGYKSASVHAASWFSTADQSNGWFQMTLLSSHLPKANTQIESFKAWALDPANWKSKTDAGQPGIDFDGWSGAQCADLGIAWSSWVGRRVGFDGWDASTVSKPGWRFIPGNLGSVEAGDVITRVGGTRHVVVVVGTPISGKVSVLQQNPKSPAVVSLAATTTGTIWRLS